TIKTENSSNPEELDSINRKIMQLEIEEKALNSEDDEISAKRLVDIEKELAELREKQDKLQLQVDKEKEKIELVSKLRFDIDRVKLELEKAENEYNLEKASELKYSILPKLEDDLREAEDTFSKDDYMLLKQEVGGNEIANIVAQITGIPVKRLAENEKVKLINLADSLHKKVVGQDEAVQS
ncbi:ATP-dependent chaperone ClpB, partial [Streptococcus danieliae]|nr:ATP-dependent chaperone ClpB [Streptococcus danieliae]